MASVDNGDTISSESASGSPANGLYGYNSLNDSRALSGSNALRISSQESDFGNTILFPASAYDSLVEPAVHFYKLRGYYTAGTIFETWVSSLASNPPPSGHTLVGITIVDEWTV